MNSGVRQKATARVQKKSVPVKAGLGLVCDNGPRNSFGRATLGLVSVPPHGCGSEGIRAGGKESSMFSFRRAVAILAFIWLVSTGIAAFGQDSGSSQPTLVF